MNVVMVVMERKGRKKTKRININNVAAVSRQGWVFGRWKKKEKKFISTTVDKGKREERFRRQQQE